MWPSLSATARFWRSGWRLSAGAKRYSSPQRRRERREEPYYGLCALCAFCVSAVRLMLTPVTFRLLASHCYFLPDWMPFTRTLGRYGAAELEGGAFAWGGGDCEVSVGGL